MVGFVCGRVVNGFLGWFCCVWYSCCSFGEGGGAWVASSVVLNVAAAKWSSVAAVVVPPSGPVSALSHETVREKAPGTKSDDVGAMAVEVCVTMADCLWMTWACPDVSANLRSDRDPVLKYVAAEAYLGESM